MYMWEQEVVLPSRTEMYSSHTEMYAIFPYAYRDNAPPFACLSFAEVLMLTPFENAIACYSA